jgi:hypothetical protein
MIEPAKHSAIETLRTGRQVQVRALRPEDRDDFVSTARRVSAHSLQRRFFSAKHEFTENEISFFVDVDFANHVALLAEVSEDNRRTIVGRVIRCCGAGDCRGGVRHP